MNLFIGRGKAGHQLTLIIWMEGTLRYKKALFPKIMLRPRSKAAGRMVLVYTCFVATEPWSLPGKIRRYNMR